MFLGKRQLGFPGASAGKASACKCRRPGFDPWITKIPWRRKWQPTPVLLPGKSHWQRSLVDYSPRDRKELDMTERLHFHFHFLYHSNRQIKDVTLGSAATLKLPWGAGPEFTKPKMEPTHRKQGQWVKYSYLCSSHGQAIPAHRYGYLPVDFWVPWAN